MHPGRLAKILTTRKPQRYGWILGEPAEVARRHPDYLAACVGVALARPDHGIGVPTSDPAGLVEILHGMTRDQISDAMFMYRLAPGYIPGWMWADGLEFPPQNMLPLLSASNQAELDARLPHGLALGRLGWRWGLHLEPLLGLVDVLPVSVGPRPSIWPSWVVLGAPKGHVPEDGESLLIPGRGIEYTASELRWYRSIIDQCRYAGIPCWLKSPPAIDGEELRELPVGWPK